MVVLEETFETLREKMKGMDLPAHRKMTDTIQNYRWLRKNIVKRNKNHPRFQECIELLDQLIEAG